MRSNTRVRFGWLAAAVVPLLLVSCAGSGLHDSNTLDRAEAVLALPASQVRDAVAEVFTQDGYGVDIAEGPRAEVTAGTRRETAGPWNWLLRTRFGVGRTQAEATITELADAQSRLQILVRHEGKASWWNRWSDSPPPIPQSAGNYLRLVKNQLKVL